jgi:acyl carrier protein
MTREEIRQALLRILGEIAPEADLPRLQSDVPLRDQLDIDSIDYMNFLIAIDERLRVEIPETDYARVASLDQCVNYVAERLGASRTPETPSETRPS